MAPTPTPTPVDPSLAQAQSTLPDANAGLGQATPEPTAIGVPKWQTVGGRYIFKGTKYAQVIQGGDGKYYGVDPAGNPLINPDGSPAIDEPITDRAGNPIKLPAQYAGHVGTPVNTPRGATSRIEPGSPAAAAALAGPARYNEGDEVAILASMPVEQRAQVQRAMIDRGLAPSNAVSVGGYDANWASSFKQVLAFANANNQPWDMALQSMPIADRTQTATVQRNHYNVTLDNPQDLAAIFRKVASDQIGGSDVPQGFVDGLVSAYQEMQRQNALARIKDQEAAANEPKVKIQVDADGNPINPNPVGTDITGASLPDSAQTATGATASGVPSPSIRESTDLPSPAQFAQDQIISHYAGRYNATQIARQYDVLSTMLGTIGGGAGGSTVGTAPSPGGQVTTTATGP